MKTNRLNWGKWSLAFIGLAVLLTVLGFTMKSSIAKDKLHKVATYEPWEKETVELVESFPVLDGGRVKPLATYAGFDMLTLHGARKMEIEGKGGKIIKLRPAEWMMDTLFRPDLAVDLPTFRIDNSKVLEAIGVPQKSRRDRYSYNELESHRDKLIDLAKSFEPIEKAKRDPVQSQTIDLAYSLRNYESLLGYFGFARNGIVLRGSGKDGAADQRADLSAVMATAPQLRSEIAKAQQGGGQIDDRLQDLLQQVLDAANFSKFGLFILPPKSAAEPIWLSAGDAIMSVMTMESKDPETAISDVKSIETAVRSLAISEKEFRTHFAEFKQRIDKRVESRGQLQHIDTEVSYFKRDYFLNALVIFLIGSLCALGMWAFGWGLTGKIFSWATFGFTVVGGVYCVIAIVTRCIIMDRPPVGNLYDTVIFIGTALVFLALLVEWMTRRRFSLGFAPILGASFILLSRLYELGDASDHMNPLPAVLISNFWLSTHVITITLGYAAGLFTAVLSCGYIFMRALNLDGNDKELRRTLTKAVYGCLCFTAFLALVGTVLGGIWANYSWGRFWGWDPKENGALMIVLWTLAILHARLGGIIKEWGLHLFSVFTAIVVGFSWWHVNFLGVGLHNYGFTAEKKFMVFIFYGVVLAVMLIGMIAMFVEKLGKRARRGRILPPNNPSHIRGKSLKTQTPDRGFKSNPASHRSLRS